MKLHELLRGYRQSPDFGVDLPDGHNVHTDQLSVVGLTRQEMGALNVASRGLGALAVSCEGVPGVFVSLGEDLEGKRWNSHEVEGAHTRKAYRVSRSPLQWEYVLADQMKSIAEQPGAEVGIITMRSEEAVEREIVDHTGADLDPKRLERALLHYRRLRERLEMEYSGERELFVVEIKRG